MSMWGEFNVKQEQRRDLLRQVEQQRLVRQALAGRPAPTFQASLLLKFWLMLF